MPYLGFNAATDIHKLTLPCCSCPDLQEQAAREEERAAEVRSRKLAAELSKNTTVDDLTRGIINYKYLGLDFEKAENQKLRYDFFDLWTGWHVSLKMIDMLTCANCSFSFSQIDPDNPSRKFWFVLGANEFDAYDISDCSPAIDQDLLQDMVFDLNANDDLGHFVMKMRLAFVQTI